MYVWQKIDSKDHSAFLSKLGLDTARKDNLISALSAAEKQVKAVIDTPLMLTLFVSVYTDVAIIPSTIPEFFEKIFHVLAETHDGTKGLFVREKITGLTHGDIREVFSCISYVSKEKLNKSNLTDDEFEDCAIEAKKITGINVNPKTLKTELVETICLLAKDGIYTSYIHNSIQDFYVAYFIKSQNDVDFIKGFYESMHEVDVASYTKWQEAIKF
ncbi:NACHT domain-containing NTPase [Deefgea sp. CFH1-16]|uniref:NACHT domain-containing protein n=1 Tax=Deefgea sp. CFH1-16 TaxID=2675457 RepID=UPI0015F6B1FB|nr:hypothetical protein [Deefgea sp. CFH1-16]MBM5574271.1 hypothetical protein [Deefgea sp. CFH1-16]